MIWDGCLTPGETKQTPKPFQKHDDILGALRVVAEYNVSTISGHVSTSSGRKTLR